MQRKQFDDSHRYDYCQSKYESYSMLHFFSSLLHSRREYLIIKEDRNHLKIIWYFQEYDLCFYDDWASKFKGILQPILIFVMSIFLMEAFNNLLSILFEKERVGKVICWRYLMNVLISYDTITKYHSRNLFFHSLESGRVKSGGYKEESLLASSSFQELLAVLGFLGRWPHRSAFICFHIISSSSFWQICFVCLSQTLIELKDDLFISRSLTLLHM